MDGRSGLRDVDQPFRFLLYFTEVRGVIAATAWLQANERSLLFVGPYTYKKDIRLQALIKTGEDFVGLRLY